MKKISTFILILVGVAIVLSIALANLELTAILAGAILVSAVIKQTFGPIADSL